MSSYNDKVTWFVTDYSSEPFMTGNLELFSAMYLVFDPKEVTTYEELIGMDVAKRTSVPDFNVELINGDTLYVSFKPIVGIPVIQSVALITKISDKPFLLARVDVPKDEVASSYLRIIKMKLPSIQSGSSKIYPNVRLGINKSTQTPIGSELVSIQEHHHNVRWSDGLDTRPVVSSSAPRYVLSAEFGETHNTAGSSFSMSESGELSDKVSGATGRISSSSGAGLTPASSSINRIVTDTLADILANVMEEYLMATNSIQILGQRIPEKDISFLNSETETNKAHILVTDRVDASNKRSLFYLDPQTLRNWLVERKSVTSNTTVKSSACITFINAKSNFTFEFEKKSQIAIVYNDRSIEQTKDERIEVTFNSTKYLVYPQESIMLLKDSNNGLLATKNGSSLRLDDLILGNIGFKQLKFISKDSTDAWGEKLLNPTILCSSADNLDLNTGSGILNVTAGKVKSDKFEVGTELKVGSSVTMNSSGLSTNNLTVSGTLTSNGTLTSTGTSTFKSGLTISNNSTLKVETGSTLNVADNLIATSGSTTFSKAVTITSPLTVKDPNTSAVVLYANVGSKKVEINGSVHSTDGFYIN